MSPGARREELDAHTRRTSFPVSFGEALRGWRDDAEFRAAFLAELDSSPYAACFWETPPITRATLEREFEFVLKEAPALAGVAPEPRTFREHFTAASAGVATFWNLGRDALLVAPTPTGDYAHLSEFTRLAPAPLQHAFWQAVGAAAEEQLGDEPLWISTSGLGVYWLHVRLDSYPKYYTHAPYRSGS